MWSKTFLAVVQLLNIHVDSVDVLSIPASTIHEPNVSLYIQVMQLVLCDDSHQPQVADWEWAGSFEPWSATRFDGLWIEVLNPSIKKETWGHNCSRDTYVFATLDLRGIAALLYEHTSHDVHHLLNLSHTDMFPYQTRSGELFWCLLEASL